MTGTRGVIGCEEALAHLWEFIDGELDADRESAVLGHLEICGRCYPQYDFQRAYFEFARRVRDRHVAPVTLRRRLFQSILLEETSGEKEQG